MENIMEIKDSKIITDIINNAFFTVAEQFNYTKENAPRFPAFIDYEEIENNLNNGLKMYGYYIKNKIVGCIGYSYHKDQIYYIQKLATLPEYRHMGIGKKLMKFAEDKIRENNGKIIEITVVDQNITLIEWYKKLNFEYIRTDDLSEIKRDGKKIFPFNSYVMNKKLE